jgi:chloramphenicol-sensitive protein RarD
VLGRTQEIRDALRSPRLIAMATLTAALITVNWGTYVWAIGAGHSLDAAMGYFINPLISIFMGSVLLKEKLRPLQIAAIGLAAIAVVVLAFDGGGLPWIALTLAFSWAFYAFFRKTLPLGPNQGFLLEVLILSVPAILYILYLELVTGEGHFIETGWSDTALLLGCGLITAAPLMIYANGAKLLKLSTIGIMQYIAPTMIFLIAIFAFHEPLGTARMIAFPLIWAGLVLYTVSMLNATRGR